MVDGCLFVFFGGEGEMYIEESSLMGSKKYMLWIRLFTTLLDHAISKVVSFSRLCQSQSWRVKFVGDIKSRSRKHQKQWSILVEKSVKSIVKNEIHYLLQPSTTKWCILYTLLQLHAILYIRVWYRYYYYVDLFSRPTYLHRKHLIICRMISLANPYEKQTDFASTWELSLKQLCSDSFNIFNSFIDQAASSYSSSSSESSPTVGVCGLLDYHCFSAYMGSYNIHV